MFWITPASSDNCALPTGGEILRLFGLQKHTPIAIGSIAVDLHIVDSAINNKR
jgi:hypothetical protein